MKRRIIEIDEEKCTGCGLCADACHEGAIALINGKALLIRDDYCDGFGDCLPACPVDAISFVEREAAPYDEAAVLRAKRVRESADAVNAADLSAGKEAPAERAWGGCPGSVSRLLAPRARIQEDGNRASKDGQGGAPRAEVKAPAPCNMPSELRNWPIQIKLAPTRAPYFDNADLLVAADCTAFSYGSFHADFLRGKTALIACPKLDAIDYSEKLSVLFASHAIRSVTVVRMEVPCCGGLERAVRAALQAAGSTALLEVVTVSIEGTLLDNGAGERT